LQLPNPFVLVISLLSLFFAFWSVRSPPPYDYIFIFSNYSPPLLLFSISLHSSSPFLLLSYFHLVGLRLAQTFDSPPPTGPYPVQCPAALGPYLFFWALDFIFAAQTGNLFTFSRCVAFRPFFLSHIFFSDVSFQEEGPGFGFPLCPEIFAAMCLSGYGYACFPGSLFFSSFSLFSLRLQWPRLWYFLDLQPRYRLLIMLVCFCSLLP